jgi:pyridoxamine 5'-phosphate oxidase
VARPVVARQALDMSIADRRTEYETAGLRRAHLDPDPIRQWQRWYTDAVETDCTEPNAMVLSTVDADGRADARFVLVRGVDERGFRFYTNLTSAKATEVAANASAALTFGWLQLHRQVRVRGVVEPVDAETSDAYFASRPRSSQVGAWASAQSSVLSSRAELDRAVEAVDARYAGVEVPRPPHWGGLRVVPDELEFWQGRPSRLHDRFRYRRTDASSWEIDRLWP